MVKTAVRMKTGISDLVTNIIKCSENKQHWVSIGHMVHLYIHV